MAIFITLEGGDGSGKSTLLSRVREHLTKAGVAHICTREPGGTTVAEEIREILLRRPTAADHAITPMTELLLYEASRAEHVHHVVRPALKAGKVVLCDRYTDSSLAYQGAARGLGLELVRTMNDAATGGLVPELTIWLKLSPEEGRKRTESRGELSRLDAEKAAFHEKVYDAFLALAEREPERFAVLNASKAPDEVFAELLAHPNWKKAGLP